MLSNPEDRAEKKRFLYSMLIPFVLSVFILLSFILEKGMDWDFHTSGLFPRRIENIWGIFTMAFIHADWGHLCNNILSFFILSSVLYYFYSPLASKILVLSYLFSGLVLWVIGRGSWHIGASGLVYALAFFLFGSGILRKHAPLIAISLIVVFLYGNIVWHLFPRQEHDPVSWEGHIAGALTGMVLAVVFRKQGPQKPEKVWEEEEETEEEDYEEPYLTE